MITSNICNKWLDLLTYSLQILNNKYRYQNQPTDVLAFASLEVDIPQPEVVDSDLQLYLGDIVISVETAFRQAKQQGHPLITELTWLAAHGFLHLLGWDHLDQESWQKMVKQQLFLLNAVGEVYWITDNSR